MSKSGGRRMKSASRKNYFSSSWPALIIIAITCAVIYSNIYHAPFVFDDANIKDIGSNTPNDNNFKHRNFIVYLTFVVNYKLSQLNVTGYHIANVIIHVLNGLLVYFLSLAVFRKLSEAVRSQDSTAKLISLFAALVYVAHPIQTEAVTYTIQRTTSMAAMFYMASVFLYLKARIAVHRYSLALYILSALCGISAFLCKPNAACLPGAILLVEYILINRTWQGWKKVLPWFAISFILWVAFILYMMGVFSGGHEGGNFFEAVSSLSKETAAVSRWQYLCTQFNVITIYVRLLFLPIHQCLDYVYSYKAGFFDGYTPMAFTFLLGLIAVGVIYIRKQPVVSLAIFWFFVTLSIESSIIPISDTMFEHRLYLPMFGFAIIVVLPLTRLLAKQQYWVIGIYIAIVIALGTAAFYRNSVWQSKLTLWSDVVLKNPKNARAHNNLGIALFRSNRPDEAIFHYQEALRIMPVYADAHCNMGNVLIRKNKFEEAIFHYKKSLQIEPGSATTHNNLANALVQQNRYDEALLHYKEALRIKPNYADVHNNLGSTFLRRSELDKAIFHYKEALRINPGHADARRNLEFVQSKKR